jgi:hypothetical protein
LVRLIRQRWSIENGWHWPRDTQLQEDAYRYVHAGQQQRSHDIKGMLALGGDTSRDDYQPDHPDPWGRENSRVILSPFPACKSSH